jgi:hypothetical protein
VSGGINGLKVVESVRKPSFFAFSPGDMTFETEVRALYDASGAKDKRLVIVRGGWHGTEMLRRSADKSVLRSRLLLRGRRVPRQVDPASMCAANGGGTT